MYCIYCGTEIKSEKKNCPQCGKALQMVPDYSIYDEDDINLILENTKDVEVTKNSTSLNSSDDTSIKKKRKSKSKMDTKTIIILTVVLCAVLIIFGLGLKFFFDNRNNNSYSYQMKLGDEALFKEKYEDAEEYYLKALTLSPNDLKVRLKLADVYISTEEVDEAIAILNEILVIDKTENYDAYKKLFDIHNAQGNIDAILALRNRVSDENVLRIFKDYIVDVPSVNVPGGTYSEIIALKFVCDNNLKIYYTLDGSNPIANGILYVSPEKIEITDAGMHTVKLVAMNSFGVYSDIVTETYILQYQAPADPEVTPNGGTFYSPEYVYITVPEGCSAYYTWDRTTPTTSSEKYAAPILIPEGYNILSVIIVDDATGLSSAIYRGVFEYTAE